MEKLLKNKLLLLLLFGGFAIPALMALFHQGFFSTDDGEWMIIRFSAFYETIKTLQIPVRFLGRLNNGYGYPLADFVYPGFMYLGVPLHILGFNFVNTIKIILGFSLVSSGIFTIFWLRKFFSSLAAFIGGLIYIYLPYHLYDIYKRGSVGEVLALAIVPFVLWQIERKSILWISFGIGLLILSHNILAFLFLPFLILYSCIRLKKINKTTAITSLGPFILGLLLSAFFWFPAIYDLQYTVFLKTKVSDWQQYFSGWNLIWVHVLTFVTSALIFVFNKKERSKLFVFFIVFLAVSLFFSISISQTIWNILPVSFIQFPFRFLSITIVCTAFLVSFSIDLLRQLKGIVIVGIIIFVGLAAIPYFQPDGFFDKGDPYYATNMATTTVKDEYMPVWVKKIPKAFPQNKIEVVSGNAQIQNVIANASKINFLAQVSEKSIVQINTIYFPGWDIKINGMRSPLMYNNPQGLMQIPLNNGTYTISAHFSETPFRLVSDLVSITTFSAMVLFLINERHKKKSKNK